MPKYGYEDKFLVNLFENRKFRISLQLAINSERINNDVLFSTGRIARCTVLPSTMWWKPEYETKYVEYDPQKAKALLDEIGVVDTDGDGWREHPDQPGKNIHWVVEWTESEGPKGQVSEVVVQNWKAIGLNVDLREQEAGLYWQRMYTDLMAMSTWHGTERTGMLWAASSGPHFPSFPSVFAASGVWYNWYKSGGQTGLEPPEEVKELYSWWVNMAKSTSKEEMLKWGQKILDNNAENVWNISTRVTDFAQPIVVKNDVKNFPLFQCHAVQFDVKP